MALINFSGIASGIDSSSLIKALLDQQRSARINPLKDKISALEDTNSAYAELSSLVSNLKSAASKFRTINGSAIQKGVTSSNENVVSGSASGTAANGQYSVTVSTLARNATFSFNDRFASADDVIDPDIVDGDPAANRTVTFTIGTGASQETVAVELTSTSTLSNFVAAFNSNSTKAEASVVNVGTESTPSFAIVVTSLEEGTEDGQIGVSVGSSITTAGAFTASTISQATNAQFSISGITGSITRSSNKVNDVLPGINLTLASTGTSTITVQNDTDATATLLQDFVDAYNEVVRFIAENDLITREEDGQNVRNIFGPLADSSLDENLTSALRSALSSAGISGGSVNILADLGITTQRDGTLAFNTDTFEDALTSDPTSVLSITTNLGELLASVGGTIDQFTQFNGLIDQTKNSNQEQIKQHNSRISDIELALARQEETLIAQFARLEALIGTLNSQQSALSGLLPS